MDISRRSLFGALGAGAVALAGCSGSASMANPDCTTEAVDQGDAEVLQDAIVSADEDNAVLTVTFSDETAADSEASYLDVSDAGDQIEHRIPVDDQRSYSVTIGSIPFHGVYRISAIDDEGTELDWLTVEFNCADPENT
jgi:hypothetical protein